MKKMLCLLLALLLVLSVTPVLAEDENLVYQSNFTFSADGWYGRGGSVSIKSGALYTEGRQSDWNSPGRDFDLVPGGKYQFSVEVFQDEMDSANFIVSVAHTADGTESYENLARGAVNKGEWVKLSGEYTAGAYSRFVLYVETMNAPQLSYTIRNFILTAPDGIPEPLPTEAPMELETAENLPSLSAVYAGQFDFGCAMPAFALFNKPLTKLALEQFNIITPENELKPDSVLDVTASKKLAKDDETQVAVHFDAAKSLLSFAKENGLKMHGHVLVWHSQTPEAFFHESYDAKNPLVSREVMLRRMENYIKGVMNYMEANYPGVIVSWDVVNEAIDDGSNWLRKSNWYNVVGEDFVARAFEYARKYAPEGTLLYYNDYNTAMPGKLKGITKLLESLIAEGNIDGYGFQMHHSVGSPSNEAINQAVEKIAALGLRLRVSELDIGVDSNSESSFQKQADKYENVMRILLSHSDQFEAVQVWGLTDNMSWRKANHPLLFDSQLRAKPAFWALVNLMAE